MKAQKSSPTADSAEDAPTPKQDESIAPGRVAAIVGRPNVGKSSLFNRLAQLKIAIVHDQPGITRDRLVAECRIGSEEPFEIIDTGGIGAEVDGVFSARVQAEAEIALQTAAVILFVVDGRAGLTGVDQDLAKRLRRADRPVLLVINKVDVDKHLSFEADFARLGFKETYSVSAAHGRGIGPLVAAVERHLRYAGAVGKPVHEDGEETRREDDVPKLALVGRPNVGKSSLTNAFLGEQRTIVSNVAGTTRDAVDIPCVFNGHGYLLIDTAGIRHRGKRDNSAEIFSVMRSEQSIRRSDLCVLVIDASEGVTSQDRQIAGLIQKSNKACVIAINKWDLLVPPDDSRESLREFRERWLENARAELFFLSHAPLVALSALRGEQVERLFKVIEKVRRGAKEKISTGPLNRLFQGALELQPPPLKTNARFKILYVTQIEDRKHSPIPIPSFLLFVNKPSLLTDTYRKYLENKLREVHPFLGLPLLFKMRGRDTKDED